jgi:hypothetical protein
MDRDGLDVQLARRPDDAASDFASIGDQDSFHTLLLFRGDETVLSSLVIRTGAHQEHRRKFALARFIFLVTSRMSSSFSQRFFLTEVAKFMNVERQRKTI